MSLISQFQKSFCVWISKEDIILKAVLQTMLCGSDIFMYILFVVLTAIKNTFSWSRMVSVTVLSTLPPI